MELSWVLIGLMVLIVFVAIGHGLWLLAKLIIVGVVRIFAPPNEQPIPAHMCPRCGEAWNQRIGVRFCYVCGWGPSGIGSTPRATPERLLSSLKVRLERYERAGLISAEARSRIVQAIFAEEGSSPVANAIPLRVTEPPRPTPEPAKPIESPIAAREVEFLEPEPATHEGLAAASIKPVEDVTSRARKFAAAREISLEPSASPAAPEPADQSKRLSALLAGFLAEKNIRWGELVGGLLIVGCSLALVISFWSSIAERPFLKFGLFNGVTAMLYLVGIHAERRWSLPTTARGMFLIATLLVPLNFMAVAAVSRGSAAGSPWAVGGELVAAAAFAWLTFRAGRSLVSRVPSALTVGVLAPSLMMLLIRRWIVPGGPSTFLLAFGVVPLLAQGGALAALIRGARREPEIKEPLAVELLHLLGLSTFAAALAMGLLIAQGGPVAETIHRLAPLSPLAAAGVLASGLVLWRRTTAPVLVGFRTAGAAIAAAGIVLLLSGIVLAWPEPAGMLPVSLLSFGVLTTVALLFEVPAAHVLAGGCLVLAYSIGCQVATSRLAWAGATSLQTRHALLSSNAAAALAPLVIAALGVTGVGMRRGRRSDAQAYALVAGFAAVLSIGLVSWLGFGRTGDPAGATWVYGVYAVTALVAASWFGSNPLVEGGSGDGESKVLAWLGSGLLLAGLVQGLVYRGGLPLGLPWIVALLAHAAVMVAAGIVGSRLRWDAYPIGARIGRVLGRSAYVTSFAAAGLLTAELTRAVPSILAIRLLWLAALWLILAWRGLKPTLFAASQAALAVSVVFAVTTVLQRYAWYIQSPHPWLDPWTIQAQAVALGGLCIFWIGARLGARSWVTRSKAAPDGLALLNPDWPAFDRFLRGFVFFLLVALALYGVAPGVAQELTPRDAAARLAGVERSVAQRVVPPETAFEVAGVPHAHALGLGSWAVLGVALAVLLAGQWERFRRTDLIGALIVVSMAAPLAAGRWESTVSAASALRWASAMVFLITSMLVWDRDRLRNLATMIGWRIDVEHVDRLERHAAATVITLALLPLWALAVYVGVAALWDHGLTPDASWTWALAGAFFVVLATFAVAWSLIARRLPARADADGSSWRGWMGQAVSLLLLLGVLPLLVVTVYVVGSSLAHNPIVGPEPGSTFARWGDAGSYVPPIVLLASTLVGYAIRERSSRFAFAAGMVFNVAATTGLLLTSATSGLSLTATLWIRLALLNASVASAYALAWMGAIAGGRRWLSESKPIRFDGPLATLVRLGVTLVVLVLIVGTLALLVEPVPRAEQRLIAGPWGWSALVLAAASVFIWTKIRGRDVSPQWLGFGLLVAADFAALGLVFRDTGNWLVYHGLLAAMTAAGFALPLVAWHNAGMRLAAITDEIRGVVTRWSSVALGVVVLFAIRAYPADPISAWWTITPLLAMVLLAAVLAAISSRSGFVAVGGVLMNVAATCWWCNTPSWRLSPSATAFLADFMHINAAALALPVPAWIWLDRRVLRRGPVGFVQEMPGGFRLRALLFPKFASWAALLVVAVVVLMGLPGNERSASRSGDVIVGWVAIASVAVAMASWLWDGRAAGAIAGLYLLGMCACGWILEPFHLSTHLLTWTGTMVLAAYSVGASYLWNRRTPLRALADRVGIPRSGVANPMAELAWLIPANLILAATVMVLAFQSVLTETDATLRALVAHAALAEVLAIGLLAQGEKRSRLQAIALGVGVLGAVAWGWAWIAPNAPFGLMDRMVVVLVALVAATALYGIGLGKLLPRTIEWTRAAKRLLPALLVLSAGALVVILATEWIARWEGRAVPISIPAIIAVAVALVGAGVAALVAAIVPGRDPFNLSDRVRTIYVYGAEAILAILCVHLKITLPWIFTGFFLQYWPLIIVGVAFVGAGLSEVFRRQGRLVLAEPLERTGALLPVLPLLASFWMQPKPGEGEVFLVLTGSLYATLALMRSSSVFSALAALAFNGALWTFLGRSEGFGLARHPQLWVIPPALCVLAGAYLNRDRLSKPQILGIRNAASLAIYLSSTLDIFLTGVARAPWLPIVLAALSIAGIFAGVFLRIRGFLYLGLGFLIFALFSIIWHAAVNLHQTWLWAATGIVAGIAILLIFALFEKKREDVLRVVAELKEWNP
jgi:hypothetical protein